MLFSYKSVEGQTLQVFQTYFKLLPLLRYNRSKDATKRINLEYIYRVHAIERMFQRDIDENQVEKVIEHGEVIESYRDDKPYPSFLVLGYIDGIALHVVYAKDDENNIIVITAYRPNVNKWKNDLKTRKV